MTTFSFSGGSFGAPYTVPSSLTSYDGPWSYLGSFDDQIFTANGTFAQLVDNTLITGLVTCSAVIAWRSDGIFEMGLNAINTSRSGFSVLFVGTDVSIRKEVAGSGGTTITSAVPSGISADGDYVVQYTWNPATGAIVVTVEGVQKTTGTYNDITTGLRAGIQNYRGGPSSAFKSFTTTFAAPYTIDTISSPVTHGQTGRSITTTGLGSLTSLTVDTVAVTSLSASGGDGTFAMPARADGATLTGYGTKNVVAGDGVHTANSTIVVNPPSTQSYVTLTSVNTTTGYLGAYRTLNVGDQIAFDTATTLGVTANYIDADGGIYTDFAGTQTIWHWVASTRVTTQITLINGIVADTTPDTFIFTDVTGATVSTVYTSNTITVAGINSASAISITGGTYSIDGGAYVSTSGTVNNGQTVIVRATSSGSFSTAVNAVLTIGGVSDTYTVTTAAIDTTPNAFTFTDITGATLSTVYTSNTITVAGINSAATISITGGTYSINGGSYVSSSGTVTNGQTVAVRVTSSSAELTAVNAVLTIGGVSDTYTVTTLSSGPDTTPNAFTFTDVTNQATNSVINSAAITVAGINLPSDISVVGGLYSINGGAYVSTPGFVNNGDQVSAQVTTPWTNSTATNAVVTIGGVSDTFTATTTTTVDTTPTAFVFTDVTGASQNSANSSNPITITGINAPATVTISGGTYSINGGAFTSSAGSANYNDVIVVKNISSASLSTTTNAVLTVGGVSDTYSVTTASTVNPNGKGQRLSISINNGI